MNKSLAKISLAIAVAVGSVPSHAESAFSAPLGLTVSTPSGPVPAYVPILVPINTHLSGSGLLELPSHVIIQIFATGLGPLGTIIGKSFDAENNHRYAGKFSVPASMHPEDYIIVRTNTIHESVSGANLEEWTGIGSREATFRFGLEQKDLFKGSSWFGGVAIAVAKHKGRADNPKEADDVLNAVIAAVQQDLNKAAATRKAAERKEVKPVLKTGVELLPGHEGRTH